MFVAPKPAHALIVPTGLVSLKCTNTHFVQTRKLMLAETEILLYKKTEQ